MASGVPVIAADRPLNREMCGEAASFYPPEDADALASEIIRIRDDPTRRARMVAEGRVLAQRFSWDTHVDQVMAVVADAIA